MTCLVFVVGLFTRRGAIYPLCTLWAHIHVHEARVGVITDAQLIQSEQVIAQRVVGHALDGEVAGAAAFVFGVFGKRGLAVPGHDTKRSTAKRIAHLYKCADEAWIDLDFGARPPRIQRTLDAFLGCWRDAVALEDCITLPGSAGCFENDVAGSAGWAGVLLPSWGFAGGLVGSPRNRRA